MPIVCEILPRVARVIAPRDLVLPTKDPKQIPPGGLYIPPPQVPRPSAALTPSTSAHVAPVTVPSNVTLEAKPVDVAVSEHVVASQQQSSETASKSENVGIDPVVSSAQENVDAQGAIKGEYNEAVANVNDVEATDA